MVLLLFDKTLCFVGVEHQLSRKHSGKLAGSNISSLALANEQKLRKIDDDDAPINHGIQDSPATKPTLCTRHKPFRFDEEGPQSRVVLIWWLFGPRQTAQSQNLRYVRDITLSNSTKKGYKANNKELMSRSSSASLPTPMPASPTAFATSYTPSMSYTTWAIPCTTWRGCVIRIIRTGLMDREYTQKCVLHCTALSVVKILGSAEKSYNKSKPIGSHVEGQVVTIIR